MHPISGLSNELSIGLHANANGAQLSAVDDPSFHQTGFDSVAADSYDSDVAVLRVLPHLSDRLPDELLAEIFGQIDEDKNRMAWSKLSGVCRRWRSVALATPMLWSHIHPSRPSRGFPFFHACLERSQSADLTITLDDEFQLYFDELHRTSRAGHIVSLTITATHIQWEDLSLFEFESLPQISLFVPPMPRLDSLTIRTLCNNLSISSSNDIQFPPIGLRSLCLQQACIPLASRVFSLQHLDLHGSNSTWTMESLFRVLTASPDLQFLRLIESLPYDGLSGSLPVIFLPKLRRLHLGDNSDSLSFFFAHISLDVACRIEIEDPYGNLCNEDFMGYLPSVVPQDTSGFPSFHEVERLRVVYISGFSVSTYLRKQSFREWTPTFKSFSMNLNLGEPWRDPIPDFLLLTTLSTALRHSPLLTLEIIGVPHVLDLDQWTQVFEQFPSLGHLSLAFNPLDMTRLRAVCPPTPSSSGVPLYPRLRSLALFAVQFPENMDVTIREFLEYRASQNLRLESLTVKHIVAKDNDIEYVAPAREDVRLDRLVEDGFVEVLRVNNRVYRND